MDKKFKGKIISSLRKLSFTFPPRNAVKKRQKRGPSTFECESCGVLIYEGSRNLEDQIEILELDKNIPIIKGKTNLDHIDPVIPLEGFPNKVWDWDVYINRLFCKEDGFSLLCENCHNTKTEIEDDIRKSSKKA
jgi:hypothetical protein